MAAAAAAEAHVASGEEEEEWEEGEESDSSPLSTEEIAASNRVAGCRDGGRGSAPPTAAASETCRTVTATSKNTNFHLKDIERDCFV